MADDDDDDDEEEEEEEEEEVIHVVPGDRLQAKCTSGPAHPAPNLTLQVGNTISDDDIRLLIAAHFIVMK